MQSLLMMMQMPPYGDADANLIFFGIKYPLWVCHDANAPLWVCHDVNAPLWVCYDANASLWICHDTKCFLLDVNAI